MSSLARAVHPAVAFHESTCPRRIPANAFADNGELRVILLQHNKLSTSPLSAYESAVRGRGRDVSFSLQPRSPPASSTDCPSSRCSRSSRTPSPRFPVRFLLPVTRLCLTGRGAAANSSTFAGLNLFQLDVTEDSGDFYEVRTAERPMQRARWAPYDLTPLQDAMLEGLTDIRQLGLNKVVDEEKVKKDAEQARTHAQALALRYRAHLYARTQGRVDEDLYFGEEAQEITDDSDAPELDDEQPEGGELGRRSPHGTERPLLTRVGQKTTVRSTMRMRMRARTT